MLEQDNNDYTTYPELGWDAKVRDGSSLHPQEQNFIHLRTLNMSSQGENSLHRFLDLPPDETADPRDVPLVALGGSGGGYRSMYGFTAFISTAKKYGLWDCITWTAGVSGTCWTLAAYYTIARQDTSKLIDHYLTVASELAHPVSIRALDTVARSKRGIYFLVGPLVSKAQKNIIGLGIMDLYATLTTTYQLLSREPRGRLSRATFQWSKVWHRSGIDKAMEPMPILTAIRRVPRYSFKRSDFSAKVEMAEDRPDSQNLDNSQASTMEAPGATKTRPKRFFQWFEITPLEIGSPDLDRYVPTWSWGRSFISGHSVDRQPEQSLSLLLGQCTSAPAGPLTGYITALIASMSKDTIMRRLLNRFNAFLQLQAWEGLWGNPIRAGQDPNPFYGMEKPLRARENTSEKFLHMSRPSEESSRRQKTTSSGDKSTADAPCAPWEAQGRMRLMDSGISNNLPNHVLARPERDVDIFLAFDASTDVETEAAVQRLHQFAADLDITLKEETRGHYKPNKMLNLDPSATSPGSEIESRYINDYARVFCGKRHTSKEIYIVYCPLLPNGLNPDFHPSTASFSTSLNLVWTPDQVKTLVAAVEANASMYAIETVRRVMRRVYEDKKAVRMGELPRIWGVQRQLSSGGTGG
ncbi:hypothetical protein F66182_5752 [Fusarium sp. NRRL 66182]|nr:hypothetical protein F66182_5752 [Fusarium sp. NRRL 66182]